MWSSETAPPSEVYRAIALCAWSRRVRLRAVVLRRETNRLCEQRSRHTLPGVAQPGLPRRDQPVAIPPGQRAFLRALDRAIVLGAAGRLSQGYTCLLAGLEVEREAAEKGDPEAAARIPFWELALLRYCERFA